MTKHPHPITPPPELVDLVGSQAAAEIAKKILQWAAPILRQQGADQELEACVAWLDRNSPVIGGYHLRIDRRPKPPSLKEQALAVIENSAICDHLSPQDAATIRRALEALPE